MTTIKWLTWPVLGFGLALLSPARALGHCDGLDGPVVKAAQSALETQNPALVRIWVQPNDESEILTAFEQTLAVRTLSSQAKALADRFFFGTVVRPFGTPFRWPRFAASRLQGHGVVQHNGRKADDSRGKGGASMAKFLIEVPHEPERLACARVVQLFLSSGSHFLAQADWGCEDGNHSAWMIVDVDSKDDARTIVPPPLRSEARIVGLNKFTIDQIDNILKGHRL